MLDLLTFLEKHKEDEKASFHMPGHKGRALFERFGYGKVLDDMADLDITEIPGADDLRGEAKEGIIRDIEKGYGKLYGSGRSYISVNGSSAGIMAAVMTAVRPGHKLLAQAGSHISVRSGAELAGAKLGTFEPEEIRLASGSRIRGQADPEIIKEMLLEDGGIDAVLVTSPNYFGVVSDIKSIANAVHDAGKILIVDEAHGAHLKFFGEWPKRMAAEDLGADIVIASTHKTLCSFTQTAVANLYGENIETDRFREELLRLESTSSSYVLMSSLAICLEIMEEHGNELISSWKSDLECFYGDTFIEKSGICNLAYAASGGPEDQGFAEAKGGFMVDRSKIVLDFSAYGITGKEAEEGLISRGIFPEFSSGSLVQLLTGIGNVREDYERLIEALKEMLPERTRSGGIKDNEERDLIHAPGEMRDA